jgi:homoserine dehydrogenase
VTSATPSGRTVGVGILGCGSVGSEVLGILEERPEPIAVQAGARLTVAGVAVRDPGRERPPQVRRELLTSDAKGLVTDPSVEVVVEVIGGLSPAGELVRMALEAGKPVVTANKALLASPQGVELRSLASERGVDLLYEASVAGAIPLVRVFRESLTGEHVRKVIGIVNGTTNFILTKMGEQGADYGDVLAEAQALGFAERDPTADVEGFDSAAKAAILAGVAFGYDVADTEVLREGITAVRAVDVEVAERFGYVIKPLAVVERIDDDSLSVRVHPAMVPKMHPLAGVRGAFNAVFVEGEAAGELMLYGQGAGGLPTASAVVGDLIDAVRNRLAGTSAPVPERKPVRLLPPTEVQTPYFVSLDVSDRPGVLAAVAAVFGNHSVSIRSMEQEGIGDEARLHFLTHLAREGSVRDTLAELGRLEVVEHIGAAIRIVGDEG